MFKSIFVERNKMSKKHVINNIQKILNIPEIEDRKVELIFSTILLDTPYKCAQPEMLNQLLYDNYKPGFFELSKIDSTHMIEKSITNVINFIADKEIKFLLEKYSEIRLYEHVQQILSFHINDTTKIKDVITIQEREDIVRKIIYFLITGNLYYTYNSHKDFNKIAFQMIPEILKKTNNYNFHDRLKQSIVGGLIGVNLKDKEKKLEERDSLRYYLSYNGDLSLEDNINIFNDCIEKYIDKNSNLTIDFFDDYDAEVIHTKELLKVCWITDDYLETIFQLKFIEEQLDFNKNLTFYVVPRCSNNYTNDISALDIKLLLQLSVFEKLKKFALEKRLILCENGFDEGMFNGLRLSQEAAEILSRCDKVVISGCRSFETAQDIKKDVFYTGLSTVNML